MEADRATERPRLNRDVNMETGADPAPQLYDLAADQGEHRNLPVGYSERVQRMTTILASIRTNAGIRR